MRIHLLCLLWFTGCANMDLLPPDLFNADFPAVSEDKKTVKRTPSSPLEQNRQKRIEENTSLVKELQAKVEGLSQEEYRKYIQIEQDLGGISERIYYLGLSPREKDEYLKIRFYENRLPREIFDKRRGQNWRAFFDPRGYFSGDIALRMGKKEVIHRWGPPTVVEIAGNPSRQNERWTFIQGRERKIVYFEGGKVMGWILPNE